MTPKNAQRVQDDRVFHRHFLGMDNNLVGVVNDRIYRQTPRLVTEDALALLTSRLRVVPIAVIRDWIVVEHNVPGHTWRADHLAPVKIKSLPNPTAPPTYRATESGLAQT